MNATDDVQQGLARVRDLAADPDTLAKADGIRLAESLIAAHEHTDDLEAQRAVGWLQVERARMLSALDHDVEALEGLTRPIEHFAQDPIGAEALALRFRVQRWLGRDEASLADLAELTSRFAASPDPAIRRALAASRDFRLGWLVNQAGEADSDEAVLHCWSAVAAADDVVVNHLDDADLAVEGAVSRGLLWKARMLRAIAARLEDDAPETQGLLERAQQAADVMFGRFAGSEDADIRERVAASESEADVATMDADDTLVLTERGLALSASWDRQPEAFFAIAARHRAWALDALDREEEAHAARIAVFADHGATVDPEVQVVVAECWADDIAALRRAGQIREAEHAAGAALAWLDGIGDPSLRPDLRGALHKVLDARADVLAELLPPESSAPSGRGGVTVTDDLGRVGVPLSPEAAAYIRAVDDMSSRLAGTTDVAIRRNVAEQLAVLGAHLRHRDHLADAEAAYRRLIVGFADEADESVRNVVAVSMLNLGYILLVLGNRPEDAVAVYDDFLARFGQGTSSEARSLIAKVNASRQSALTLLYDRGLSPAGVEQDELGQEARERIRTTLGRANELVDASRYAEAIAVYDEVIDAYPAPRGADLRMRVCDAMVRKGYALGELERWQESVLHHREFLAEFGTDVDMTIEKDVALGSGNLALALSHLDRTEEEVDAYSQILRRWGTSDVPYLIYQCARAIWKKGYGEVQLGRTVAAEDTYTQSLRYLGAEESRTRVEGAKGGVNLSIFLRKRNRLQEATAVASSVIEAIGDINEPGARKQLAKAYLCRARALAVLGDIDGARMNYEWVLSKGAMSLDEQTRKAAFDEFMKLVGGPIKGAWSRFQRWRRGRQ